MREISVEYGAGLFAAARDAGVDGDILAESRVLSGLLTREYLHLVSNPDIPRAERVRLIGEVLDGRAQPYLANLVKLMIERSLAFEIHDAFAEYEKLYYEHHAIVKVSCESAVALTDAQKEKLQKKLEAHTDRRVEIEYKVISSLIGGVKLSFDNRLVDGTVKNKLREIGVALTGTVV
jgi:F-type H+-transporting ATPase subunit delta